MDTVNLFIVSFLFKTLGDTEYLENSRTHKFKQDGLPYPRDEFSDEHKNKDGEYQRHVGSGYCIDVSQCAVGDFLGGGSHRGVAERKWTRRDYIKPGRTVLLAQIHICTTIIRFTILLKLLTSLN
jgi:hypothetical protein